MKVYIAGPYTQGDTALHVRRAVLTAEQVVAMGHSPYVPHLTMLWHLISPHDIDFWYAHDLEWLEVCDVVLRLEGASAGADAEELAAERHGIPVVHSIEALALVLT